MLSAPAVQSDDRQAGSIRCIGIKARAADVAVFRPQGHQGGSIAQAALHWEYPPVAEFFGITHKMSKSVGGSGCMKSECGDY